MQQPKVSPLRLPRTFSGRQKLPTMGLLITLLLASFMSMAGEADVVNCEITALGDDRYRLDVTVRHADSGWEHYADRWDVLAEDGTVLGTRELAHPHENEQPFTRSLTLTLPPGTKKITLRANDSVHGLGGQIFELIVPGL